MTKSVNSDWHTKLCKNNRSCPRYAENRLFLGDRPKLPNIDVLGLGLAACSYPGSPCMTIFIVLGSIRNLRFCRALAKSLSSWRPSSRWAMLVSAPIDTADAMVPGSWWRLSCWRACRWCNWITVPSRAITKSRTASRWTATLLNAVVSDKHPG